MSFGCRFNQIRTEFENFLEELTNNGAELIFVFKRSQNEELDFIENYQIQHKDACEVFDVIETFKKTEAVVRHFETRMTQRGLKFEFPLNQTLLIVFAQTAKKYGKLHVVEKGETRPSTGHVQLANKNRAMALMGTDSYYVFDKGSWRFWVDNTLDMKNMTVQEVNKELVLQKMNISVENAPLFASLAGGLESTEKNLKRVSRFFNAKNKTDLFNKVSIYIRRQRFSTDDESLKIMIRDIFGHVDPEVLASFHRTFELMNTNTQAIVQPGYDEEIKKIFDSDYLNFGDQILRNQAINLSSVYTDLR